jgi:hypothetical protein
MKLSYETYYFLQKMFKKESRIFFCLKTRHREEKKIFRSSSSLLRKGKLSLLSCVPQCQVNLARVKEQTQGM